jgi:GT2 family glycosyltransferase
LTSKTSDLSTYVIIVNWNGKELLHRCLRSFFDNTSDSHCRVVVVDNASTDGSVEMVQQNYSQIDVICNSVNTGFSKANNQGIRYALQKGAKQVLLLNNDVEIAGKKWFEEFTAVLESNNKIGIVGCKLLFADGTLQYAGGLVKLRVPYNRGECQKDIGQYDCVASVDYVTGAALMIKAEVIRKIGFLDEGFSPLYYEDTDWCVRAKLYGYTVVYTPKPTFIHHCGASSNKLGDARKRYYAKRSFIRFVLLNYPTKDIIKRTLWFESREAIRCLVVKPGSGKLPLVLRSDGASRLRFYLSTWMPSLRNLKGIIALRQQRFVHDAKVQV